VAVARSLRDGLMVQDTPDYPEEVSEGVAWLRTVAQGHFRGDEGGDREIPARAPRRQGGKPNARESASA
jgi:hypothetical protein